LQYVTNRWVALLTQQKKGPTMNKKFLGSLALGLLIGQPAQASVVVSTSVDTTTDLIGTFSIDGSSGPAWFLPSAFALLPATNSSGCTKPGQLIGYRIIAGTAAFGGACSAVPDDNPFLLFSYTTSAQTFADLSGTFDANSTGTSVFFRMWNLRDSGDGLAGTFSGAFCFQQVKTGAHPKASPNPARSRCWVSALLVLA
jgi:hypothetical protein